MEAGFAALFSEEDGPPDPVEVEQSFESGFNNLQDRRAPDSKRPRTFRLTDGISWKSSAHMTLLRSQRKAKNAEKPKRSGSDNAFDALAKLHNQLHGLRDAQ